MKIRNILISLLLLCAADMTAQIGQHRNDLAIGCP